MSRSLTDKQEAFCQMYVGEAGFNATEAAALAQYSGNRATLASIGAENLTKPHIRARIQELMDTVIMPSQEVAARLGAMGRGERPTKRVVDGEVERRYYDEESALEKLGKYHQLFIERHEITGAEGGPIEQDILDKRREAREAEIQSFIERKMAALDDEEGDEG